MRTVNSTFQRFSELVCFIHNSKLPCSVITAADLEGEEAELGRLAGDEAELLPLYQGLDSRAGDSVH
ncbi:MAG: hypothetical protein WAS73_00505 [Defluviicoccus sp.]